MTKALVVLSGGQDSVTCLFWAMKQFDEVEAISFSYGQRHTTELECAAAICVTHQISQKVVDLTAVMSLSRSALLDTTSDIGAAHVGNKDLPASFVPNRNAMMLTAAHAWAQTIGAETLVTGVCQTDYSGYPDCREQFIRALQDVLNLGSGALIEIQTPLMYLNKAETFKLAADLGCLDDVIVDSHTCYNGDRTQIHDWGYGCGECPACKLRAAGWAEYMEMPK